MPKPKADFEWKNFRCMSFKIRNKTNMVNTVRAFCVTGVPGQYARKINELIDLEGKR